MSDYLKTAIGIIQTGTFNYSEQEKINRAVYKALDTVKANQIILPGMTVLIKPNFVMDINQDKSGSTECMYTHPAVIREVVRYVCECLNGTGKVIIGDAPMQECNFENIKGLSEIADEFENKATRLKIVDFRAVKSINNHGIRISHFNHQNENRIINLGRDSEFANDSEERLKKLRVTNYDPRVLYEHHKNNLHEYCIAKDVLEADVIINMPKPKTHRKAGVTISLKNMVGVNTRKEYLPHHTLGSVNEGGDEYLIKSEIHRFRSLLLDKKNIYQAEKKYWRARVIQIIMKCFSAMLRIGTHPYSEGSWWGNDTVSKMITDINRIVFYADKTGIIRDIPQRKMIILADMVICGEGEGPIAPTPKNVGIIASGLNPVLFDKVICTLMGFDYNKIPSIKRCNNIQHRLKLLDNDAPDLVSNIDGLTDVASITRNKDLLNFRPSVGWKNHIEL